MIKIVRKILEHFAFNALGVQDYRKASYYFKKIVDACPNRQGVHYNYAVSLIGSKQYALAEKHLLDEQRLTGERYEILKTLGELYYTNNNPGKALDFFRKSLEHCVDDKDAAVIRKKISIAGNPKQYYDILKANSMFEQASSRLDNNQWQEALTLFKQALDYDKDNPLIYNNLGVISLNHEKEYMKAKTYFQKALAYSDLPIIKRNLDKAEFHIQKEAKLAHKENTRP